MGLGSGPCCLGVQENGELRCSGRGELAPDSGRGELLRASDGVAAFDLWVNTTVEQRVKWAGSARAGKDAS